MSSYVVRIEYRSRVRIDIEAENEFEAKEKALKEADKIIHLHHEVCDVNVKLVMDYGPFTEWLK